MPERLDVEGAKRGDSSQTRQESLCRLRDLQVPYLGEDGTRCWKREQALDVGASGELKRPVPEATTGGRKAARDPRKGSKKAAGHVKGEVLSGQRHDLFDDFVWEAVYPTVQGQ